MGFRDSGGGGGDTQAISFAGNPTETAAFFGRPPFLFLGKDSAKPVEMNHRAEIARNLHVMIFTGIGREIIVFAFL
jgi:hypothetical protein